MCIRIPNFFLIKIRNTDVYLGAIEFSSRVGRMGTSTCVPLECVHFYVKVPRTAKKKVFWSSDFSFSYTEHSEPPV
jgi:hypothetical protein